MMDITIQFGRARKEIHVVNQEKPRGVKGKLEKEWRGYLRRHYRMLGEVPICCETCRHVGEKIWHCHCVRGPMNGINVNPNVVCSHWSPNSGMLMMLWRAHFRSLMKENN